MLLYLHAPESWVLSSSSSLFMQGPPLLLCLPPQKRLHDEEDKGKKPPSTVEPLSPQEDSTGLHLIDQLIPTTMNIAMSAVVISLAAW